MVGPFQASLGISRPAFGLGLNPLRPRLRPELRKSHNHGGNYRSGHGRASRGPTRKPIAVAVISPVEIWETAAAVSNTAVEIVETAGGVYYSSLENFPVVTKSLTSGVVYGLGDILAQRKTSTTINAVRLSNFMLCGLVAGLAWPVWYDTLDAQLEAHGIQSGPLATIISMASEQFLFCPLFYGGLFIPFSSYLKGNSVETIIEDVKVEIGPTLWGNAKVWTVLNLIIYNVPLEIRAPMGNLGDLIWSTYLSYIVEEPVTKDHVTCIADTPIEDFLQAPIAKDSFEEEFAKAE